MILAYSIQTPQLSFKLAVDLGRAAELKQNLRDKKGL